MFTGFFRHSTRRMGQQQRRWSSGKPQLDGKTAAPSGRKGMLYNMLALGIGVAVGAFSVHQRQHNLQERLHTKMRDVEAPGSVYRVGLTGNPGQAKTDMIACVAAQLRAAGKNICCI